MEETNKLIAEFMGIKKSSASVQEYAIKGLGDLYETEKALHEYLQYDTKWDWLMPCVQKISLDCEGLPNRWFSTIGIDSPIELVYETVVDYLKHMNL